MNSYTQLRQPVPQILALVSLCFLVVDYLSAKYNGVLMNIPIYIIVMCLINLLVILISFLCIFIKPHYSNTFMWRNFFIITVLDSYMILYAIFNLYFIVAIRYHIDITNYWIIGISSMTLSFMLDTIANIIAIKVTSFKHHMIGLLFRFLGAFVYIVYIILYFIVPHNIDNRNDFIHLIFLTLGVHAIVAYSFLLYGGYTYDIEQGEEPTERRL